MPLDTNSGLSAEEHFIEVKLLNGQQMLVTNLYF